MTKAFRIFLLLACSTVFLNALAKCSVPEIETDDCKKYISFFNQYFQQKKYREALPYWEKVVEICPDYKSTIFHQGRHMIIQLLDNPKDKNERKKLINKLHWLYEQWEERDGPSAAIENRKKVDFEKYKK